MLAQATDVLLETVGRDSATEDEIKAAAHAFFNAASESSRDQVHEAMRRLAGGFQLPDTGRAGFVALICGSLIEDGCDPEPVAAPLVDRLGPLLEASARLVEACLERMPKPTAEEEEEQDGESGGGEDEEEDGHFKAFQQAKEQLAGQLPDEAAAWDALAHLWRPAIAVFSTSSPWRARARSLREPAARIADYHEAGHWLALMLSVLDDEPILVIEPAKRLGMLGRMSGVADNFQLHVLLMDVFPQSGFWRRRRVPRRVAQIAKGNGPQRTNDVVTGKWNLYTWQAVRPDLGLPDPKDFGGRGAWIWGEGIPEDVPVFEGHRVILLGPPSYVRTWQSQRTFGHLRANVECTRVLGDEEINAWLRRMSSATSGGDGPND